MDDSFTPHIPAAAACGSQLKHLDLVKWLEKKLGDHQEQWTGRTAAAFMSKEMLEELETCFQSLEPNVKLKLILAIPHLPQRAINALRPQLISLIGMARLDPDDWVETIADMYREYPTTGKILPRTSNPDSYLFKTLAELRDSLHKQEQEGDFQLLAPSYTTAAHSVIKARFGVGDQETEKHFALKRKPKSSLLAQEVLKAAEAAKANSQKSGIVTSLPIKVRSTARKPNNDLPMRGIPKVNTCKLSAGFTNEPKKFQRPTPKREGGAKLIDICEIPHSLKKRRLDSQQEEKKKKAEEKELQRKKAIEEKEARLAELRAEKLTNGAPFKPAPICKASAEPAPAPVGYVSNNKSSTTQKTERLEKIRKEAALQSAIRRTSISAARSSRESVDGMKSPPHHLIKSPVKFVGPAVVTEPVRTTLDEDERMEVDTPTTSLTPTENQKQRLSPSNSTGGTPSVQNMPKHSPEKPKGEPPVASPHALQAPTTSPNIQQPLRSPSLKRPSAVSLNGETLSARASQDSDMDSPVKRMVAFLKSPPSSTEPVPQLAASPTREETNKMADQSPLLQPQQSLHQQLKMQMMQQQKVQGKSPLVQQHQLHQASQQIMTQNHVQSVPSLQQAQYQQHQTEKPEMGIHQQHLVQLDAQQWKQIQQLQSQQQPQQPIQQQQFTTQQAQQQQFATNQQKELTTIQKRVQEMQQDAAKNIPIREVEERQATSKHNTIRKERESKQRLVEQMRAEEQLQKLKFAQQTAESTQNVRQHLQQQMHQAQQNAFHQQQLQEKMQQHQQQQKLQHQLLQQRQSQQHMQQQSHTHTSTVQHMHQQAQAQLHQQKTMQLAPAHSQPATQRLTHYPQEAMMRQLHGQQLRTQSVLPQTTTAPQLLQSMHGSQPFPVPVSQQNIASSVGQTPVQPQKYVVRMADGGTPQVPGQQACIQPITAQQQQHHHHQQQQQLQQHQRQQTQEQQPHARPQQQHPHVTQGYTPHHISTSAAMQHTAQQQQAAVQQNATPNYAATPNDEADAHKARELVRRQCEEMLRSANRLDTNGQNIVLDFMTGNKHNPRPELGSKVTLQLSETVEEGIMDGRLCKMKVETFFQMDYASGEWKRLRKCKLIREEDVMHTQQQQFSAQTPVEQSIQAQNPATNAAHSGQPIMFMPYGQNAHFVRR